jgi:alpha-N-arabinofuranosidase
MNSKRALQQAAEAALIIVFLLGCGAPTASPTVSPVPTANASPLPLQYTLPTGPSTALTVSLDAADTGEPISPYVYGMFIEHQGRCIYGGIWAEMLRDRKFYYPVNSYFPYGLLSMGNQISPWRAVPFDTVVTMDTKHAWVGKHSPQITLDGAKPRGVVQDRLTLQQGRDYDGRVTLAGDSALVVEVSLVWGSGPNDRQTFPLGQLTSEYTTMPFHFTAGAGTDDGSLEIIARGEGYFYIGAVSLMPADNVQGMRADTLQLLQGLDATVYRWPGGTFVWNYHWQNAVGYRDKRAPFLNSAYWSDEVESNDFGPDEFMTLVKLLNTEAYIAVSAMSPDDTSMAAAEVEYFNGAVDTPMGQLRAANGHPEPYGVRFWSVGNESWAYAALNDYVDLHKQIAAAMKAVDPSITIIAVGGRGQQGKQPGQGDWSEVMLSKAGDSMDLISEHVYGEVILDDLPAHAGDISRIIKQNLAAHRQTLQENARLGHIRVALDEWNYSWWDFPQVYGEAGPRYPFANALGIAAALHEIFRNSDLIYMANTHPVNVHGHIKTTATDAAFEVTALPWIIYRHHFGTLPVAIHTHTSPLDLAVAWTEDHQYLTVAAVNATEGNIALTLDLKNARLTGGGQFWIVTSDDPLAYNEPGRPPRVVIQEGTLSSDSTALIVPALSVILYNLPARIPTTRATVSPQGCTDSEYSAGTERIGVMRSTDGSKTWEFLGHACFHAPTLAPVDISPTRIGNDVALYFVDVMSFAPGRNRTVYRALTSDGVLFTQPVPVYSSTTEQLTDPYVLRKRTGEFIMYLSDAGGIRVTVSTDQGATFTSSGMVSLGLSVPGALQLPDGSVRLLGGAPPTGSDINGATSPDGLSNFVLDAQPAIQRNGADMINDAQPISLSSGGYLMSYKVRPAGAAEDPAKDLVYLATSTDGYTWTTGTSPIVKGSVPSIVELADGTLLLYYVDFNY